MASSSRRRLRCEPATREVSFLNDLAQADALFRSSLDSVLAARDYEMKKAIRADSKRRKEQHEHPQSEVKDLKSQGSGTEFMGSGRH